MAKGENRLMEAVPLGTSPKARKVYWPRARPECQKCKGQGGTPVYDIATGQVETSQRCERCHGLGVL